MKREDASHASTLTIRLPLVAQLDCLRSAGDELRVVDNVLLEVQVTGLS